MLTYLFSTGHIHYFYGQCLFIDHDQCSLPRALPPSLPTHNHSLSQDPRPNAENGLFALPNCAKSAVSCGFGQVSGWWGGSHPKFQPIVELLNHALGRTWTLWPASASPTREITHWAALLRPLLPGCFGRSVRCSVCRSGRSLGAWNNSERFPGSTAAAACLLGDNASESPPRKAHRLRRATIDIRYQLHHPPKPCLLPAKAYHHIPTSQKKGKHSLSHNKLLAPNNKTTLR